MNFTRNPPTGAELACYHIPSFSPYAVVSILNLFAMAILFSFIYSDSDLDLDVAAPELLALMKERLPG